jgi:glycosyltransferase involved in cell wall biosynthesis
MHSHIPRTAQKRFDACFVCITELRNDARTLNLARTLVKHGKKVCILATGKPEDVVDFFGEDITLFYISANESPRAWKRILDFNLKALKYRYKAEANTYWAMDLYSLYVAKELSKLYSGRLIYDSREIYSALGTLYKNNIKQAIQTKIEKRLVRYVDNIIVSGRLDAEYLDKHFKEPVSYDVIMNLPPMRTAMQSNMLRKQFGIAEDKKIILYQGMLMKGRGIIPLINALPHIPNAVLCLLGEGDYNEVITAEANRLGVVDRVIFCGKVDYDKLHELTSSADIGAVLIEPVSLSYKLALPNKLFEYCMAGLPVLASNLPAMAEIFREFKVGRIIEPNASPEDIAYALNDLTDNKFSYSEMAFTAAKKYNYGNQTDTILKLAEA